MTDDQTRGRHGRDRLPGQSARSLLRRRPTRFGLRGSFWILGLLAGSALVILGFSELLDPAQGFWITALLWLALGLVLLILAWLAVTQ